MGQALKRIACGRKIELAMPCGTPCRAPTVWLKAWPKPTWALEKAAPARVAAMS